MAQWRNFQQGQPHTVVGTLLVCEGVFSPQLNNSRLLFVWLPNSYTERTNKRYPVLYMHDGDNLFDAYRSFAGEWRVDETLTILEDEGLEAIVVGIPNNEHRMEEYSPYADKRIKLKQGKGNDYLRWIIDTIKPLIDQDFRTLTDVAHTGIMGSSLGGLISLYGFLKHPDVFGFAGVMSPAHWVGNGQIVEMITQAQQPTGKLYMDIGGKEGRSGLSYMQAVRRMADTLKQKGYIDGETLSYVEDEQGSHNEDAWAYRLPDALRFLLRVQTINLME